MDEGANVVVNVCANVTRGEEVLIICDAPRYEIAHAVKEAADRIGGRSTVIITPPRGIDNEEPPQPVAGAMRTGADVIFLPVGESLSHTKATREALLAGARVVSMAAFTADQMERGGLFADFESRKPLCDDLAERISAAQVVQVTNPAGTHLTFRLDGRSGNSHACIVRKAGEFTAVPNIEANCAPVEGSAEGQLVVDGSIPYYGIGPVKAPIRMGVSEGRVVSIENGEQASFLRDLLSKQEDENVYNIAQFAMGLNPECKEFTGQMLNDEGVDGTIHVGVGTSANLGGEVQAKTHFDAIIRSPSVWFDEELVMEEGEMKA